MRKPNLTKNLYALTELATGSLAACSSILEVGKDETFDSKARGNSKIRLYFTSDRCRKLRDNSVHESDHGSRAQSQEASTKSDDICSNTDQSSKDFAKIFRMYRRQTSLHLNSFRRGRSAVQILKSIVMSYQQ